MIESNCTLCGHSKSNHLMTQKNIPIFQNKIFASANEALSCTKVNVGLNQCQKCGFVFNSTFDPSVMNYDSNYQNEQANSMVFQEHLQAVLEKVLSIEGIDKKVVEVGCGKGHFLEILRDKNIDCIGFDPTYEGDEEYVVKEYFTDKFPDINADVIVLRHTLEHIHYPLKFIQQIAKANNYKGKIFIEVPTFQWINDNEAFWDVFYEHCNYFTLESLSGIFGKSEGGHFFGGQYIYLIGDLSTVKTTIDQRLDATDFTLDHFRDKIEKIKDLLSDDVSTIIWGAGGKGSTFVNLLDADRSKIKYVIDINPVKQSKFISNTAHPIYSPEKLSSEPADQIIIMNPNYQKEISDLINDKSLKLITI